MSGPKYDGYYCDTCGKELHPVENHVIGICSTCNPEEFQKELEKRNYKTWKLGPRNKRIYQKIKNPRPDTIVCPRCGAVMEISRENDIHVIYFCKKCCLNQNYAKEKN